MNLDFIEKDIPDKIFKSYEDNASGHRPHMGGSQIGHSCDKYIWLSFRHAYKNKFPGRILRLFNRGHREEPIIIQDLKDIGVKVWQKDEDGNQFGFSDYNSHFKGSIDGVGLNIPGAEKTPHLLEFKTASDKKFKEMVKKGVEKANHVYYVQMQVYMEKMSLTRALFIMVNKNDDNIYSERVKLDKKIAKQYIARAEKLINLSEPPEGISDNPTYFECKWCSAYKVCYKYEYPEKNCRTCCYSTPIKDGWSCDQDKKFGEVCENHLYIPSLLSNDYEMYEGSIKHKIDDKVIYNHPGGELSEVPF